MGNQFENSHFLGILMSLLHFSTPIPISWDHFPDNPLSLEFLFQALLLEKSKQKEVVELVFEVA